MAIFTDCLQLKPCGWICTRQPIPKSNKRNKSGQICTYNPTPSTLWRHFTGASASRDHEWKCSNFDKIRIYSNLAIFPFGSGLCPHGRHALFAVCSSRELISIGFRTSLQRICLDAITRMRRSESAKKGKTKLFRVRLERFQFVSRLKNELIWCRSWYCSENIHRNNGHVRSKRMCLFVCVLCCPSDAVA